MNFIPDDKEVSRKFSEYASMVNEFKNNTSVQDYIRVRGGTNAIPDFRDVTVRLERNYKNFTLADLSKLEDFLANQFLLNQFIFRLKDVEQGCVQITWLVPAGAIPLLKPDKLAKKDKALRERRIREVWVDGRYVYKVNTTVCMHLFTTKLIVSLYLQSPNPTQTPRPLFPNSQNEGWLLIFRLVIHMYKMIIKSSLFFHRL